MEQEIQNIKNNLSKSSDYYFKKLILSNVSFYLIYSEVITNGEAINDFILRSINFLESDTIQNVYEKLYLTLPSNNVQKIKEEEIYQKLVNSYALLYFDKEHILAVEMRNVPDRGVNEANSEMTIQGPKDAFNENFNTNLGLVRRRLKSKDLFCEALTIGKISMTKVGVIYLDNIVEESLVDKIKAFLNKINIDGILDSGYLKELLESENNHLFPTVMTTERPDKVSMALLEGKVVLLVDNSPYALIIPTFFIDYLHTPDDYYQKPINITFIRVVRLIAFFISIFIPAYYIAVTTHNHDSIPLSLLLNFSLQRASVPFPALIEALLMTLSFEILRESDTRMPSNMGTAVSILGGLVLGDAAVAAGIVSPIMIIVIAISAISALVNSSMEMISALRFWRITFLYLATLLGIYGIFLGILFFIIKLVRIHSFGKPYLAPFSPIIPSEQKDAIVRTKRQGILKRNPLLTKKNKIRGRLP